MSKYIMPEEWMPVDSFDLEDNALETVKSRDNRIIVAGPGAGKTELLAQRACYLLQTNICPSPKKILAISFKRDAAFNLAQRVEKRVGKKLARRFTVLTFDGFSKGLVDRFRTGLPELYRPKASYIIDTTPISPIITALFEKYSPGITSATSTKERNRKKRTCIKSLTNDSYPLHSSEELTLKVLNDMFKSPTDVILTFPILSRLAQLLLSTNPKIVRFLRQTYSHVFLDEFQDTTRLQYDLLKEAFLHGDSILTAVGDTKQRIMLWAGAMDGIFESYKTDFKAINLPLLMNFRSAPRLVHLQNYLAKELMGSEVECIPRKDRTQEEGIAQFWFFKNFDDESKTIASYISDMISQEGIDLREICLLYKQRPDHYATALQASLQNIGIHARVENELQDLLVEPVIQFIVGFIFSALSADPIIERNFLLQEYSKFGKIYDDESFLKMERKTIKKLRLFKNKVAQSQDWGEIERLLKNEIKDISFPVFSAYYPQYNERKFFDQCIKQFFSTVKNYFEDTPYLLSAIEKFVGKNCVPIMTVHKSKGLEFSTVFFIGFEDQNFWSFKAQPEEDTCSFFVALSRAKDRVFFTFSEERINGFEKLETRTINAIRPIYDCLRSSKLVEGKDYRKIMAGE